MLAAASGTWRPCAMRRFGIALRWPAARSILSVLPSRESTAKVAATARGEARATAQENLRTGKTGPMAMATGMVLMETAMAQVTAVTVKTERVVRVGRTGKVTETARVSVMEIRAAPLPMAVRTAETARTAKAERTA